MSRPALIQVPYHLGRRDVGPGKGVHVLAEALADGRADLVSLDAVPEAPNEIAASMEVVRALAECVKTTSFPIILAGNCNSCLGTVTGIGGGVGVVWFDAHGDFNTPRTSPSGFLDGMGLAMLTGSGWATLREGLATIPEAHVVHVGGRDFDPAEEERLDDSRVQVVRQPPLDEALDGLRKRVEAVYVHVDLDVLDPSVGRANWLAVDDGLTVADMEQAIDAVGQRFEIRAAAITWYEPDCDPDGAIPPAARAIYDHLLAANVVAA
jgi:arginase